MISRRALLRRLGLGAAGAAVAPHVLGATSATLNDHPQPEPLSCTVGDGVYVRIDGQYIGFVREFFSDAAETIIDVTTLSRSDNAAFLFRPAMKRKYKFPDYALTDTGTVTITSEDFADSYMAVDSAFKDGRTVSVELIDESSTYSFMARISSVAVISDVWLPIVHETTMRLTSGVTVA